MWTRVARCRLAVRTLFPGRLFHWESQIRRDFLKRFSIKSYHRESEQGRAREAEREKGREILLCCSAVLTWIIKSLLIFIPGVWLTLAFFAWGFCLEAWLFSLLFLVPRIRILFFQRLILFPLRLTKLRSPLTGSCFLCFSGSRCTTQQAS